MLLIFVLRSKLRSYIFFNFYAISTPWNYWQNSASVAKIFVEKESLLVFCPVLKTGVWIRIRIGPGFNDFVDPEVRKRRKLPFFNFYERKGKKWAKYYYLFILITQILKIICLDKFCGRPDSMVFRIWIRSVLKWWIPIRMKSIRIHNACLKHILHVQYST
jgi:hypothetical protein